MNSNKKIARIVGILILLAYALLGGGNPNQIVLSMFLEVISGLAVIGIAILMTPLFKPYGKQTTQLYLLLRSIEGGALVLTGLLFLSSNLQLLTIRDNILAGHGYIFSLAALLFYYLLYKSRLIPRWISIWGAIASVLVILVNTLTALNLVSELMILYLPIIANEIFLAIWLLIKGFNHSSTPHRSHSN